MFNFGEERRARRSHDTYVSPGSWMLLCWDLGAISQLISSSTARSESLSRRSPVTKDGAICSSVTWSFRPVLGGARRRQQAPASCAPRPPGEAGHRLAASTSRARRFDHTTEATQQRGRPRYFARRGWAGCEKSSGKILKSLGPTLSRRWSGSMRRKDSHFLSEVVRSAF